MSDTTTCASCGHALPANAAFCTNCGAKAQGSSPAPDQPVDDATRVDTPGLHDSTAVLSTPPPPSEPPAPAGGPWQPGGATAPPPPAPGAQASGQWGAPAAGPPPAPSWQQPQAAPGSWAPPGQQPPAATWGDAPTSGAEGAKGGGSPLGGIAALLGGLLTLVGIFLAWVDDPVADGDLSGWDLTSGDRAFESSDPYLLLVLALVALAVGVVLFLGIARPVARIAAVVVGLAIIGVLVRDWLSISDVVKDNFPSSVEVSAKLGFYLAGAGGVLTALAALGPAKARQRTTV